jgi:hypothetical protein
MRRHIVELARAIAGRSDGPTGVDKHCADGNFPACACRLGFRERALHMGRRVGVHPRFASTRLLRAAA